MKKQKAIILGGSMAGLLAARVCANHFQKVVVLEKDPIEDKPLHRKGVPQDHQIHILLSKGFRVLTKYFRGIMLSLENEGAITGDIGQMLKWYCEGDHRPNCETGEYTAMMSRPLLEYTVRWKLLEYANVYFKDQVKVESLISSDERIIGVKTTEGEFLADLVIDARGVASNLPSELKELGFPVPEVEKVKVNVKYTSFVFERDEEFRQMINTNSNPPMNPKHGTIQPIEGGKMIAMVQGRVNDQAPQDIESFKAYTQELETSEIYEMIKNLEPVSEMNQYHIPHVRWIHYEKLKSFPKGILPFGDAICRLNPVYGQGISSSAIQAEVLDKVLASSPKKVNWKKYFRKIAKEIKNPWDLTVTEDFKFEGTEGIPPKLPGILVRYFAKVNRIVNQDPITYKSFLKVLNMMSAPTILLKPSLIWRVIRAK